MFCCYIFRPQRVPSADSGVEDVQGKRCGDHHLSAVFQPLYLSFKEENLAEK